jgi:hypothetical protein
MDLVTRKSSSKIHILGSISVGRRRHRLHGSVVVVRTNKIMKKKYRTCRRFKMLVCFFVFMRLFANGVTGTLYSSNLCVTVIAFPGFCYKKLVFWS